MAAYAIQQRTRSLAPPQHDSIASKDQGDDTQLKKSHSFRFQYLSSHLPTICNIKVFFLIITI